MEAEWNRSPLKRGVRQLRLRKKMEPSVATDLKCHRCGAEFFLPDVPSDVKGNVSAIAHSVGRVNAILELKNRTNIGLPDAKAIAFHLSEGDTCHRCGTKLTHERHSNALLQMPVVEFAVVTVARAFKGMSNKLDASGGNVFRN